MGTLHARLSGVDAGYAGRPVLRGIDLDVRAGATLAVLGPSGAGKSTLLRLLTGELAPLAGTLEFGVPDGAQRGREGLVWQDPLLFPWLTLGENIALGRRFAVNREVDADRHDALVALLGLAAVVDRYPDEVSGGQAQRAALARALAIRPGLLLLDEPFSALDPATRHDLQQWLRDAARREGLTVVIITHDLDEALVLAHDIVLVGADGRLTHRWRNDPPAATASAARYHPLRGALRQAFGGEPEPDDAESFADALGGSHV